MRAARDRYERYQSRQEYLRFLTVERVMREGIDVYFVRRRPDRIGSVSLDHQRRARFVEQFAEGSASGRWMSTNKSDDDGKDGPGEPPHRCYTSYSCVEGRFVVRVHSHSAQVDGGDSASICGCEDASPRNSLVVTMYDEECLLSVIPIFVVVNQRCRRILRDVLAGKRVMN